jgi:hypothetical protein
VYHPLTVVQDGIGLVFGLPSEPRVFLTKLKL